MSAMGAEPRNQANEEDTAGSVLERLGDATALRYAAALAVVLGVKLLGVLTRPVDQDPAEPVVDAPVVLADAAP